LEIELKKSVIRNFSDDITASPKNVIKLMSQIFSILGPSQSNFVAITQVIHFVVLFNYRCLVFLIKFCWHIKV